MNAFAPKNPYPSGEEVMGKMGEGQQPTGGEEQAPPQGQEGGGSNPVIDALKTLSIYAMAQKEKGNMAVADSFKSFVEAIQGGASEGPEEPSEGQEEMNAPEAKGMPENEESAVLEKKEQGMNKGVKRVPFGASGKAKVLSN